MKTFNKLTSSEKATFAAKCSFQYNMQRLAEIGHFLTSKVSDSVVLTAINENLEDFIEATDRVISKFLSNDETDDKTDTH